MTLLRFSLSMALLLAGCGLFARRQYQGAKSDHFDGEHFHNPHGPSPKGLWQVLRWQLTAEEGPWSEWTDAPPGPPPPRLVTGGALRVTFVNHATTLVQLDGMNVLTDPIWSERASPVSFAGPKRVRPPGLRFQDLPPIHAVAVSHDHYDHLDLPTLQRLAEVHHPRFFVPLGNAALLREAGIADVTELDWWQAAPLGALRITCVPSQHFSARGIRDRDATLWSGYVLEGPSGRVYFAGDTAQGDHFRAIRERLGPPRLAILPIGAFLPHWFMEPVHVSPEQALDAHHALGARTSVGMHFGTFPLADDGQYEPILRLYNEIARRGDPSVRFWTLDFGEGRDVP